MIEKKIIAMEWSVEERRTFEIFRTLLKGESSQRKDTQRNKGSSRGTLMELPSGRIHNESSERVCRSGALKKKRKKTGGKRTESSLRGAPKIKNKKNRDFGEDPGKERRKIE